MDSYPVIKYVFLFIMYIFAFICLFSDNLETVGFVAAFVTQNIYTIALCFDILTDPARNLKVLAFPTAAQKYIGREISIPLHWLIIPLLITQYREMLTAILEIQESYARWGKLKISRDNRIRLMQFKIIFVACVCLLFLITVVYMQYRQISVTGPIQLLISICFITVLSLSVSNNILISLISYQMKNTTDGFTLANGVTH
jgi:hypothetical protein